MDLTVLLTTGRAHASLADFLGGGEQMSERVRFNQSQTCAAPFDPRFRLEPTEMGDQCNGGIDEATRLRDTAGGSSSPAAAHSPAGAVGLGAVVRQFSAPGTLIIFRQNLRAGQDTTSACSAHQT